MAMLHSSVVLLFEALRPSGMVFVLSKEEMWRQVDFHWPI
jgi:hypothetical protein